MTIVEQIVAGEMEAVIVYRSDNVIAFADHDPINVGHILICPIHPYKTYVDLPEHVNNEVGRVAKDLYQRIEALYKPDGISFMQNNGQFNDLSHYHLHIFPRFDGDGFTWSNRVRSVQSIDKLRGSLAGL